MNPLAIIGWFTSNIKTTLIIIAIIAGGWLFLNYTAKIEEASRLKYTVQVQEETIAAKDLIIKKMTYINDANNRVIFERDKALEELQGELENLLEDLGDDIDNEAPQSLQELMRRLENNSK